MTLSKKQWQAYRRPKLTADSITEKSLAEIHDYVTILTGNFKSCPVHKADTYRRLDEPGE